VVAAIAAAFQPDTLAGGTREGSHAVGADGLVAGVVERGLGSLGVRCRLFSNRLEVGDALLEAVVQIGDAGFDGVVEPVEALVGLGDALVQFGQMLAAALGALFDVPASIIRWNSGRRSLVAVAPGSMKVSTSCSPHASQ
jgi:hypothetical protein